MGYLRIAIQVPFIKSKVKVWRSWSNSLNTLKLQDTGLYYRSVLLELACLLNHADNRLTEITERLFPQNLFLIGHFFGFPVCFMVKIGHLDHPNSQLRVNQIFLMDSPTVKNDSIPNTRISTFLLFFSLIDCLSRFYSDSICISL